MRSSHIHFTATLAGWQSACMSFARSRCAFQVHDVRRSDLAFCNRFCKSHGYSLDREPTDFRFVVFFTPTA